MNIFLVTFILTYFFYTSKSQLVNNQIVGGQPTGPREFPYLVSIQYNNEHNCAGTIISTKHVLTAGHCIAGANSTVMAQFRIVAGVNELDSTASTRQTVSVINMALHEGYNITIFKDDIALLKVSPEFRITAAVQTIALNTQHVNGNKFAIVTGWGMTYQDSPVPNSLQRLNTITLENETCREMINNIHLTIPESQICTYAGRGHGHCRGDSGGPLLLLNPNNCNVIQIGIVSFSTAICSVGVPDVYSNVAYYYSWIESKKLSL